MGTIQKKSIPAGLASCASGAKLNDLGLGLGLGLHQPFPLRYTNVLAAFFFCDLNQPSTAMSTSVSRMSLGRSSPRTRSLTRILSRDPSLCTRNVQLGAKPIPKKSCRSNVTFQLPSPFGVLLLSSGNVTRTMRSVCLRYSSTGRSFRDSTMGKRVDLELAYSLLPTSAIAFTTRHRHRVHTIACKRGLRTRRPDLALTLALAFANARQLCLAAGAGAIAGAASSQA